MDQAQAIDLFRGMLAAVTPDEGKPKAKAFKNIDASLEWSGKKIVLPADPTNMTIPEAKEWLTRREKADQEAVAINETIDAYPWDGAVAFMKAMKEIYGWANPVPTPGFFPGMENPPVMVSIETDVGENAVIFWGGFTLPGIEGMLKCEWGQINGRPAFVIGGKVKRKYLEAVHILAELTRKIAREESIYRGKALRFRTDEDGDLDASEPPQFLDLSRVREEELVFSDELAEQVRTNVFTPIEHSQYCRDNGVPLKRGVLLEGPYGTGKTLLASVVAKKCPPNGWTFITVPRAAALKQALKFAALYQPCAVFVEDIDREMEGERSVRIDDILNTLDGVDSKGAEIMVVLTSNEASKINRAMLRPGRLDVILRIGPPDAGAAEKLLRIYGRGLIKEDAPLTEAGKELAGQIPAVIREVVERAKLYAISHRPGQEFTLVDGDIARSAKSMKHHLDLLAGPVPDAETAEHKLGKQLGTVMNHHLGNGADEGLSKRVRDIESIVRQIAPAIGVVL